MYIYLFVYLFIGLSGFTVQSTIVCGVNLFTMPGMQCGVNLFTMPGMQRGVNLFTMPGMQCVVYAKLSKVLVATIVVYCL